MTETKEVKGGNSSAKPILAIDVDEVLCAFLEGCAQWHNEKYGTNQTAHDFVSYNFCETWGVSDSEARHRVFAFLHSDAFLRLKTVPGAYEALKELQTMFRLAITTSRQKFIEQETKEWLKHHFPDIEIIDVKMGNCWMPGEKKVSKSTMVEELGAVCLIDDLPYNCKDVSRVADHVILFNLGGKQKWSEMSREEAMKYPKIKVLTSWPDIVQECRRIHQSLS